MLQADEAVKQTDRCVSAGLSKDRKRLAARMQNEAVTRLPASHGRRHAHACSL